MPPKEDDPMETDAPASSSTPAPPAEGSTEGSTQPAQDVDMTRGEPGVEQAASTTPATPTEAPVHKLPIDPDAASYLPECITHTATLLESMFSNHDTCQKFVQQGGVECLLQLYKLPKLPPTFGSSSASHSLLATFRALTVHSAAEIATRLQPALASQFRITLGTAEVHAVLHVNDIIACIPMDTFACLLPQHSERLQRVADLYTSRQTIVCMLLSHCLSCLLPATMTLPP